MKLSTKFILFIVVIHAVTIALSFFIFSENKLFFIISEFFILLSVAISWSLYNELIRPLQLLMRGADAIKDRDFNVKFVKTGKYEMDQLIEVYNHMIDQLRLERTAQQEQHYFLEKLIQTSPTGIILFDYDGLIAAMNPRALEWTGLQKEKVRRRPITDFKHPVFQAIGELKTGESRTITLEGPRTLKIRKAQFVDRGFPCDFVMIEELTADILEAEKRSYGKVIRMMAHEVNNSIGAVNSILDTTLQLQAPDSEIKPALQVAIERNEHLSQFMRNFADVIRLPAPTLTNVDLNELLKKVTQLMSFSAKNAGVHLELNLPISPLQVLADAGQIEQVLVNVMKNAIEANAENGIVSITLSANPRQLCIANNGKPIPKELEDKLFTPFFSTKNGGQGIGLTLAREILTAHGWSFSLKSDPDGWTRFAVKGV